MPSIYDSVPLLQNDSLQAIVDKSMPMKDLIGLSILPAVSSPTPLVKWEEITSTYGMAPIVASDAVSPLIEGGSVLQKQAMVCYIRQKYLLDLLDLTGLRTPGTREEKANVEELVKQLVNLQDRVERRRESLIFDALLDGTISYSLNNVIFTVDFGFNAAHIVQLTGTPRWTQLTTANPEKDFQDAIEVLEADGFEPTYALMNGLTRGLLDKNSTIRSLYQYNQAGAQVPGQYHWLPVLKGVELRTYNGRYQADTTGTSTKFIPDYYIIFVSQGSGARRIGSTYHGPLMLQDGSIVDSVNVVADRFTSPDPSQEFLRVQLSCLPVIHQPDSFYVCDVGTSGS